jgi:glutamine cyclotransferase
LTFDGEQIWIAVEDRLCAIDPAGGEIVKTLEVESPAGTAYDGKHLYQIADGRIQKIDVTTGTVLTTVPAPSTEDNSGMAWAEGYLWVGQYGGKKIHQVEPGTGAILRTIDSNRYVTGVTWVDGELWHGAWEGDDSEILRIDPKSGEVEVRLAMPEGVGVSGLESDGGEFFYAGGGGSKMVRKVRRPHALP